MGLSKVTDSAKANPEDLQGAWSGDVQTFERDAASWREPEESRADGRQLCASCAPAGAPVMWLNGGVFVCLECQPPSGTCLKVGWLESPGLCHLWELAYNADGALGSAVFSRNKRDGTTTDA
eukprot:856890-Prorocentrum_minimum.AAC.1